MKIECRKRLLNLVNTSARTPSPVAENILAAASSVTL
jgi:hypothetical protein